MRRAAARATIGPDALATSWQVISLLLEYPSEQLVGRLPLLRAAITGLPTPIRMPLARFIGHAEATSLDRMQRDYVETFDIARRCCLYLTYFAHGDTRKRGLALVQFKQAFRRAGVEFDADELPDHLCVVLEFGAAHSLDVAWGLLNNHRAGIEMLRLALLDRGSPWADLVVALVATLPELKGDDATALYRLIEQGPPQEEVGLDLSPYALDPRLNPRPEMSLPGDRPAGAAGTGPVPVRIEAAPMSGSTHAGAR